MRPVARSSESFDAVILALPFTSCGRSRVWSSWSSGTEKLKCIRELGYGTRCQDHAWHHIARVAEPRLGTSRAIEWHLLFRSRLPESCGTQAAPSRATPASSPTSWAAKPAMTDAKSALDAFRADLPKMSQKMAESLDPAAVTVLVLERLSLHARQLRQRQSRTIHDDAGSGGGARSRRPPAICRRAYQQRLPWLS